MQVGNTWLHKASWGAQIVEYEKIAAAAVEAMTAVDLHQLADITGKL